MARSGDAWNTSGTIAEVAARDAILREHCAAVGRDPASIERTVSFPIVIRDRRAEAETVLDALLAHNGVAGGAEGMNVPVLLGPPAEIAAAIAPYRDLGFGTVIVRLPAPFDAETLARIGEVRDALDAIPSVNADVAGTGRVGRVTVVVLAGGVGGAKLAHGVHAVVGAELSVVVNTGDDCRAPWARRVARPRHRHVHAGRAR